MTATIYLDNLSTTPIAAEALDAMRPWLECEYGNASSATHALGWAAAEAVELARDEVARLIGARTSPEVIFTSGATESNNTVLKGIADSHAGSPTHVVTTAIEHPSVLSPADALAARGVEITQVSPDGEGMIDADAVIAAVRPETCLVSIMLANNEVGTLQPIGAIGDALRKRGVLFHVDGAQAVGKVAVDVEAMGIDVLSLSAHKLYGPKGVGALYVRADALPDGLPPLLHGGGQEFGQRAGTLAVAQIVGFGMAAELARGRWREDALHACTLTSALWGHLRAELGERVRLNGSSEHRLPGCLNFSIEGVDGGAVIAATPTLALSTGSACSSHRVGSHVLSAMGLGEDRQQSAIRIGVGRYNTERELALAGSALVVAVQRLARTGARWASA
jgi:cysteine desulfurase